MEFSKIGKRDVTFIREMRVATFDDLFESQIKNQFSRTDFASKIYSSKLYHGGHATMPLCTTRPHELTKPALSTLLYNHGRTTIC